MLSLFVIDDSIVEFFLNANVASDLFFYLKEERIDKKAGVINLVTIMIHLFRMKSYAFSKSLKIDFLVFAFKHYEKAEEEEFKTDLLQLLCSLYQIKEFKKLLHDEEVLIEIKYRTDIVEIEELINNELEDERRVMERAREAEIAQGKRKPRKKKDNEWVDQFTFYTCDPLQNVTLLENDMMNQIDQDEFVKIQQEENEGVLIDTKTKSIQEFLKDLRVRGSNSMTGDRAKRAAEDLEDIKELILVQQENIFYKAKSKMSDLKKENAALKQMIENYGLKVPHVIENETDPSKQRNVEIPKPIESSKLPEYKGPMTGSNGVVYGKLPSLATGNLP